MMTAPATFDFLLVSTDHDVLRSVNVAAKHMEARLNCATSAQTAKDYLSRRKLDGVVVDLQVDGALALIEAIREGSSNRNAIVFACTSVPDEATKAISAGANHILSRPLTADGVARIFEGARSSMARERRRYFRHMLSAPVELIGAGGECRANITNVSEGGMAVRGAQKLTASLLIEFQFALPAIGDTEIRGKGEVAWSSAEGNLGIRFHQFHGGSERYLRNWIEARENLGPTAQA